MFNEKFLNYFAGFIDSDGNIDLSMRQRKSCISFYPKITVAQTFPKILEKFKEKLNVGVIYGNIFEINGNKFYSFTPNILDNLVIKYNSCKYIIENGRLLIDEEESAKKIISEFRKKRYEAKRLNSIDLDWFAGLIDGDGCFLVENRTSCYKLGFRLVLSGHENDIWIFNLICDTFGGYTRKLKNAKCIQWVLSLTDKDDKFLYELESRLYVKKLQAYIVRKYLIKYSGIRMKSDSWDRSFVINNLSAMKRMDFVNYDHDLMYNFLSLENE